MISLALWKLRRTLKNMSRRKSEAESEKQSKQNQEDEEDAPPEENTGEQQTQGQSKDVSSGDVEAMKGKKMEAGPNPGVPLSNEYATQVEYKIYTSEFDQVVNAQSLASYQELGRLRAQLDQKMANLKTITGRLSARLQRLFAGATRDVVGV